MKNLLLIFSVLLSTSLYAQIGPDGTGTVNGYSIGPGAPLSGAPLSGALLDSANLSGANLNGADLSGADLRPQKLSQNYVAIIPGYELNQLGVYSDAMLIPNGIKEKLPFTITNEQGEQEEILKTNSIMKIH
ncbi:MAG: pentapeptide repeat-containing protein [Coraliomargaritaceae bacterium]